MIGVISLSLGIASLLISSPISAPIGSNPGTTPFDHLRYLACSWPPDVIFTLSPRQGTIQSLSHLLENVSPRLFPDGARAISIGLTIKHEAIQLSRWVDMPIQSPEGSRDSRVARVVA